MARVLFKKYFFKNILKERTRVGEYDCVLMCGNHSERRWLFELNMTASFFAVALAREGPTVACMLISMHFALTGIGSLSHWMKRENTTAVGRRFASFYVWT